MINYETHMKANCFCFVRANYVIPLSIAILISIRLHIELHTTCTFNNDGFPTFSAKLVVATFCFLKVICVILIGMCGTLPVYGTS